MTRIALVQQSAGSDKKANVVRGPIALDAAAASGATRPRLSSTANVM
jgi:hypothetical protein